MTTRTVPEAIAEGLTTADKVINAEVETAGPYWFRTVPVEIQAWCLTEDADWDAIAAWCGGRLVINVEQGDSGKYETYMAVDTGLAGLDDWIVHDATDEDGFFVYRADAFAATYEPIPPPQRAEESS